MVCGKIVHDSYICENEARVMMNKMQLNFNIGNRIFSGDSSELPLFLCSDIYR